MNLINWCNTNQGFITFLGLIFAILVAISFEKIRDFLKTPFSWVADVNHRIDELELRVEEIEDKLVDPDEWKNHV